VRKRDIEPEMALTETGAATHERVDQTQIGVLYAGDIELARPQFASSARHLTLVPITDVIGAFGGRSVAAGVDVAVIDCAAPGVNATQIVAQLRALRLPIPILLVIDPGVENGAATALSLQADDYTVKTPGWLGRLPTRLQIVVNRHRRIKQLENGSHLEQRLKAAVEKAPVCLARVLEDGSVAAVNDAARSMLAVVALEDVLKKPLAAFVRSEHHQPLSEFIATVCRGEARSIELSILPREGDERIAELRGVALPPDASGRVSAIVSMRDLSERRRLEDSIVDVSAGDIAAERVANEQLSAEIAALRQRLADADGQQQLLTQDRDALRHAAEVAAAETARLATLLAERESTAADRSELERACVEARTAAEHAARALENAQREAAASAHQLTSELAQERQRRDALEQSLESKAHHLAEAVAARDEEAIRAAALSQECEALRSAVDEQGRITDADRRKHLDRIRELEGHVHEQSVRTNTLDQEQGARRMAESRLSELEQRIGELEGHLQEQSARAYALDQEQSARAQALDQEHSARRVAESRLSELEQRIRDEASAAGTLRERCDALEAERQRLIAEVAARDAETTRVTVLSQEWETLRTTLEEQNRATAAERDRHLEGIHELERSTSALDQERRAREAAESRLAELERRIDDEVKAAGTLRERCDALGSERQRLDAERLRLESERQRLTAEIEQAMQRYAADIAAARAALAQAVEDRDALRSTLDAERHRHQFAVAAAATQLSSEQEAVIHGQTATIETLTARLRDAEAACERLTVERDEREKVFRSLEEELQQSADSRRGYRQDLLAALTDAQRFEETAARHLAKNAELESRLRAAKLEFDELTQWASARAARVGEGL
jgi:PAS domain S-box-containing protein